MTAGRLTSRFTKEQWLCAVTAGICVLLVLFSFSGRAEEKSAVTGSEAERTVSFPVVVNRLDSKERFDLYQAGRNFFAPPGKTRLPLPALPLPQVLAEAPSLPAPSPMPNLQSLSQDIRYEFMKAVPGKPAFPATELDLSGWPSVEAMSIPPETLVPDRRAEKLPGREFDEAKHVEDNRVIRGQLLTQQTTDKTITILDDRTGRPVLLPKEQWSITLSQTYLDQYKELRSAAGRDFRRHLDLAKKCLEWGMTPEAIEEYLFVLSRADQAIEDVVLAATDGLVDLYLKDADAEKAVELLNGLLDRSKEPNRRFKLRVRLGAVWERFGLLDRAEKEYAQAYPAVLEAGVHLARVQYELGRWRRSAETVSDLMRLPVKPEARLPEAFAIRAVAALRIRIAAESIQAIESDLAACLEKQPGNARALTGRAVTQLIRGNRKAASADLVAAVQSDPYHAPAWTTLALLLVAAGEHDKAEICVAKGLERAPMAAGLHSLRGLVHFARGDLAAARTAFEASRSVDSRHFYALYGLGIVELAEGRIAEAQAFFTEAIRREFYYAPLYYNAALAHLRGDDALTAEGLLQEMLRLRPTDRDGIVALTTLYLKQGRIGDALRVFQDVVDRAAGDPTLLYLNGYITYHGDDPKAEKRVTDARDALLDAAAAGSPEATRVVPMLEEWLATYVLLDEKFSRDDSDKIGAGWNEGDNDLFPIRLVGGRCRFHSGRAQTESTDLIYVSMEREIPGKDFRSVEATFRPTVIRKLDSFGFAVYSMEGGAAAARGTAVRISYDGVQKKPRVAFIPNATESAVRQTVRWVTAPLPKPVDSDEVRLRLIVEQDQAGLFMSLEGYDRAREAWDRLARVPIQMGAGSLKLAIFARTRMKDEYEFEVDDILVLQRKRED